MYQADQSKLIGKLKSIVYYTLLLDNQVGIMLTNNIKYNLLF